MEHVVFSLKNGIRAVYKQNSGNVAHACVIVNRGSRDEMDHQSGLAHFIEHLLFKKTKKRSTSQILNRLENVGADLNAYTTKEYMCIHASFLKDHLVRTLDLFEDILFNSVFPDDEIEKEKGVILDEIASYQDQPEEAIQDDFEDLLFKGHPLGRNILGDVASVASLTRDDVIEFTAESHYPEGIVIGVCGNYETKALVKKLERIFGGLTLKGSAAVRTPPKTQKPEHIILEKAISQTHTVIGTRAYSRHHQSRTGLLLLTNLLGGNGMSSRLNLQIREKYGIAYTIDASYSSLQDTGIFNIYYGTDEEKASRANRLVLKELKKLRENRLGTVQLQQAKNRFTGQIALGEENSMGLIISLAKSVIDYGKVDTIEEVFKKIEALTAAELLEIANDIFNERNLTSLTFSPAE